MVKISAFRADLEKEKCERYIQGHNKVLESYGVTKVTSADHSWVNEPFTYIVLVESKETGEVLGGGRIQLTGGEVSLPIEDAIDKMDPRIFDLVKEKAKKGTGEYCGLWNSRKIAGYGIGSIVLMRVGIAILNQITVNSFFAFASPATLKRSLNIGYEVIDYLGNNGTFYYPKDDLVATALIMEDPLELKSAIPEERSKIFELRKNPFHTDKVKGPKGEMKVEYNLYIKHGSSFNRKRPTVYAGGK